MMSVQVFQPFSLVATKQFYMTLLLKRRLGIIINKIMICKYGSVGFHENEGGN